MKNCGNCQENKSCFYRGIQNPCGEWKANLKIKALRKKAKECLNFPLSMEEGRFVEQAVYLESFSPKQETWLMSIHSRIMSLV